MWNYLLMVSTIEYSLWQTQYNKHFIIHAIGNEPVFLSAQIIAFLLNMSSFDPNTF